MTKAVKKKLLWCLICSAAVLLAGLPGNSQADEKAMKDAANLYQQGRFAAAYDIWQAEAEKGVADAQFNLSTLYLTGRGVDLDSEVAEKWLRKSADQGYPPALHNLALQLIEQDRVNPALEFLEKAANKKFPSSLYTLGKFHQVGLDGSAKPDLAFKYVSKAAELGHMKAQYNLGKMYRDGYTVPPNDTSSTAWFRRAAVQGNTGAQIKLVSRYKEGRGVPVDKVEALKWYLISKAGQFPEGGSEMLSAELTAAEKSRAEREAAVFVPKKEVQSEQSGN